MLTDPPYGVSYEGEAGTIANDDLDAAQLNTFLEEAFHNADRYMKDGAAFYIWHASRTAKEFECAMPWTVRQQIIWNKNSMTLGRQDYQWKHEPCFYGWKDGAAHYFVDDRTQTTIIEDRPNVNAMSKEELKKLVKELMSQNVATTVIDEDKPLKNDDHPTMKPIKLLARLIRNSSVRGEGVVLDIFGGSGSTLIACEQLDRTCYMMELDPKYCEVILNRYEALIGDKPVRID